MMNTPHDSTLDEFKSTVRIMLRDPLGRGIDGLKYQILDGVKIVAKGRTDGAGAIQPFVSEIGRLLSVYVEHFASGGMKKIKTLVPWSAEFSISLLSGKVKETIPAEPASGQPGKYRRKTYIVQSHDTLSKVAKQQGTTVDVLARLNGIDPDKIRVGQVIKLPVERQGSASETGGGASGDRSKAEESPNGEALPPASSAKQAKPGINERR